MSRRCRDRRGERCLPCRTEAWYQDVGHDPTAGLWGHADCPEGTGFLYKAGRDSARCEDCGAWFDPPEVLPFMPPIGEEPQETGTRGASP